MPNGYVEEREPDCSEEGSGDMTVVEGTFSSPLSQVTRGRHSGMRGHSPGASRNVLTPRIYSR
jgi:hypothetical protein